jgi:hypothetical protein
MYIFIASAGDSAVWTRAFAPFAYPNTGTGAPPVSGLPFE